MGRYVFRLPDVGEGIAEVELLAWHVAAGETVAEEAPLVDVLTEKATVEIPSPRAGRVLSVAGKPGEKIRVGSEILVLETAVGDTASSEQPGTQKPPAEGAAPAAIPPAVAAFEREAHPNSNGPLAAKPRASPSVRKRASELGIALESVTGSGPGGRISHADLDAAIASGRRPPAPARPPAAPPEASDDVEIIGLRRRIAERMVESKQRIPHYSYVEEIDVTPLEDLRAELNETHAAVRPRLTVLPFLIAALVRAVPQFPSVNALFEAEASILHRYRAVHVGIATATQQGLLVPVVRHAETRDLWQSASEIARLTTAARDGKAKREELFGSTITISSLGRLGGIAATPIINPPEVAIFGVNRIVERPVVRDGAIVIRRMMNLSSSFDHRIIDGTDAARFIHELKRLLEQPALLFLS
ncbi:MAG: dihydrolipoamide acetyltransferase family protein [Acetobacteraceae bacterium]